ncbi:transcriptional regulator, ArsR family [mine drainage metagenome]|uniref:Transcriptional regulator, ArsR family n=2 Tax=mine drainage metagenome TaxID=410659 RepID=T1D5C6_9ZZZZ
MKQQDIFRALSDPSRRRVLKALQKGSMTAGEIGALFEFTGASLSHHLSILKSAGLVRAERRGQHILYSLNSTVLEDVSRIVLDLFSIRRPKP